MQEKKYLNMQTILKTIMLLTLISFISGCATPYMMDRKRDALDICTFTTGIGGGAKCRIGPIQAGLFGNKDYAGIRGGAIIDRATIGGFPNRIEDMDMTATIPILPTHGGFGLHSMDIFGDPEIGQYYRSKQYKAGSVIIPALVLTTAGADDVWGCLTSCPSYYTQLEFAIGAWGTVRLGLNPGELLDFFCGWFNLDIYGDDIGDSVVPSLLQKLKSDDDDDREFAVEGLGKIVWIMTEEEQKDAVTALSNTLNSKKYSNQQFKAISSLKEISECNPQVVKPAIPVLIKKLKDSNDHIRGYVALNLGWMKTEKAIPALIEALNDKDEGVRKDASQALYNNFQSDVVLPGLVKLLHASKEEEKAFIVSVIGKSPAAEPVLIKLLDDSNDNTRYCALFELQHVTPFPVEVIPKISEIATEDGAPRLANLAKDILKFYTQDKNLGTSQ